MFSLVTSYIEVHKSGDETAIGQLYVIIRVMEGLGSLLSGPCFSFTFYIGL